MDTVAKDYEVKDTLGLQAESLLSFMAMLGYTPARKNGGWVTQYDFLAGKRVISTRSAIALHNLKKEDWIETVKVEKDGSVAVFLQPGEHTAVAGFFQLIPEGVDLLLLTKLCERVKMIPNKKAPNGFSIYEHWVKMSNDELRGVLQEYLENPETPLAP